MRTFSYFAIFVLCSCAISPIGEDPRGLELKSKADSVLRALNKFHEEKGQLPVTLAELAPVYLSALPVKPELVLDAKNSLLRFSYAPSWPQPGQVSCTAKVRTNIWNCHGYI